MLLDTPRTLVDLHKILRYILRQSRPHYFSSFISVFSFRLCLYLRIYLSPWNVRTESLYIYIYIHKVSQEESAILREGVPNVKIYRYNPKYLCPKLNRYGDNGKRKVWSSVGSTHCTYQLTVCPWLRSAIAVSDISAVFVAPAVSPIVLGILRTAMTRCASFL
jgi:hypothetical protein